MIVLAWEGCPPVFWREKGLAAKNHGPFSEIFFNGTNGANGPFYEARGNWFTGRMFVTTKARREKGDPSLGTFLSFESSCLARPKSPAGPEHLKRRLGGEIRFPRRWSLVSQGNSPWNQGKSR
jgi:hypothetical protein